MSQATGDNAIATTIKTLSYFDDTNVAVIASNTPAGWENFLSSGKASDYCFLVPGGFEQEIAGIKQGRTRWTTIIELWVLYQRFGPGIADKRIIDIAEAVRAAFAPLGNLSDSVVSARIVRGSQPTPRARSENATRPDFLTQELTLEWVETAYIT
jgi:hypothetical protein